MFTATDDAIALGWRCEAELIAVAPCCQAELAAKWAALAEATDDGAFRPLWESPHLRRTSAATVTDALRTLLLRAGGYDVTALEFVASTHTPKNTLIRAMRRRALDVTAIERYAALRRATGDAGIALETHVPAQWSAALKQALTA